jgi:NitT/TauT family transport system substrate-binding protein
VRAEFIQATEAAVNFFLEETMKSVRRPVRGRWLGLLSAVVPLLFVAHDVSAADSDLGKPGQPIKLTVGHPCCYTEVWSAMALRGKELWKKYLPSGSTVEFEIGLQGSTIVNNMLAGKEQIGYVGDLPSILATTKQNVADIRMVAVTGIAHDQCNILLVRKDAPQFKSVDEAVKWLGGKQFAVPKGTCSDIFSKELFARAKVQPASYLNQNVEVITSGFRAGKLDGAAIWEPIAARLIDAGLARRIASGVSYGLKDSSYMLMSAELIKQRPDVVKAWLNAELDAQIYMADEKNAQEMIRMVSRQTTGFSERALWAALYASYPESQGGTKVRMDLPFVFTPEAMKLLTDGTTFLHSIKAINVPKLRPEAVMPEFAEEVLKERKLKSPVGQVDALAKSPYLAR